MGSHASAPVLVALDGQARSDHLEVMVTQDTQNTQDMEKRLRQYVDVRDALRALDEEYNQRRKPLLEIQEILSGIIQKFMDDNKLENLRTSAGTCYKSTAWRSPSSSCRPRRRGSFPHTAARGIRGQ